MKKSELQKLPKEEMNQLLYDQKNTLREMRFSIGQGQLKNIRSIRNVKKTIARILTHNNQKNK